MGKYRVDIFFGENYEQGLDLCIDKKKIIADGEEDLKRKISEEINNLVHGESHLKNKTICNYGKSAGVLGRIYAFVYGEYGDLAKVCTVDGMLRHPYMNKSSNIPKPVMKWYSAKSFFKSKGLNNEEVCEETQRLAILNAGDAILDRKKYGFIGACFALAETLASYTVIKDPKTLPTLLSWIVGLGVLLGIDLIPFIYNCLKIRYYKNKLANLEQDPKDLELLKTHFSTYVEQQREKMFGKTKQ